MLRFIRRLLGRDAAGSEHRRRKVTELTIQGPARRDGQRASDAYFANMAKIQGAISSQAFDEAASFVRESFRYIPDWVKQTRQEYGSFDISFISALQHSGT